MTDNIRIEQRKEQAAMQVYSGACGDATSQEEGTPMTAQPVCGYGFLLADVQNEGLQSRRQFEIEKKNHVCRIFE